MQNLWWTSALVTVLFGGTAAQEKEGGYPIAEYLEMTYIPEVAVSPDGRHIALVAARDLFDEDRTDTAIWSVDLDANGKKTAIRRLVADKQICRAIKWSADSRYLSFLSATKGTSIVDAYAQPSLEPEHLRVLDIEKGITEAITDPTVFKNGVQVYNWMPSDDELVFTGGTGVFPAQKSLLIEGRHSILRQQNVTSVTLLSPETLDR